MFQTSLPALAPAPAFIATSIGYVFVYGTLREGGDNDISRLHPAPQFVGRAQVKGTLYHLGRYPGLTLGGATAVVGEVYAITPELEQVLDEIEELYPLQTNEYFKEILPVDVAGRTVPCIVYVINPDRTVGKPVLTGGDWVVERDTFTVR